MSIDYTIAAIPTVYNGIRYRSRLEARWAALFEILKLPAEYEPADLGQWSPDFLLRSKPKGMLAEVKPISTFENDIATRMATSADRAKWDGDLLLLGIAPVRTIFGWCRVPGDPAWTPVRLFVVNGLRGFRSEAADHSWNPQDEEVETAWKAACNAVQWRPSYGRR